MFQHFGLVGQLVGEVVNDDERCYQLADGKYKYAVPQNEVKPFPLLKWPQETSSYNLDFAIETRDLVKVNGWKDDLIIKVERLNDGDFNVYSTKFPVKAGNVVEKHSVSRLFGVKVANTFDKKHVVSEEKAAANKAFVANLPTTTSRSKILVMDSAKAGTTRALRGVGYRGKIHVPNPHVKKIKDAVVFQETLHEFILNLAPTAEYAAIALDACCLFRNLRAALKRLLMGRNLQIDGTCWVTFSVRGIANPDDHVERVRVEIMELAEAAGYNFTCVYQKRYKKIGCLIFSV